MRDKIVINFRLLGHTEINKFNNFIKNQLSDEHIFSYDKKLFNWQHKDRDFYHCMAAFKNSALIGVQGVIPQCQFDSNLPRNQIFLALWQVDKHEGIGIGLKLYECILNEYRPEFIGSTGLKDNMIPFHKWKGFTIGKLDHHVILSPYIVDFKVAIISCNAKKYINTTKNTLNQKFFFKRIKEEDLVNLNTSSIYLHQTPLKSDCYLINRYFKHPTYNYILYALLENNKIMSICIIRPVIIDGSTVLRFVDYVGENLYLIELYGYLLQLLKEYNAEYIDFYSYGIPLNVLKSAGFINRNKIDGLVIPNYFEPFERKNIELNYAYRYLNRGAPIRMFKGDGDQDRPSRLL
jgi:hypothetical protein